MNPVWVAFLAGAFVWVPVGMFVAGLCVAARRADEAMVLAAYERAVRRRVTMQALQAIEQAIERAHPEMRN